MNRELLLQHFDLITEAPDAVPRLRQFILDLAVRGKLVEQNPNDEPASELLKRLEAERARLVKAGHFRAQHPSTPIGEDETPFPVPGSWEWIRVGDGFYYDAGVKREPKELEPNRWLLELEDIERDTSAIVARLKVSDRGPLSTKSEFKLGDILYGKLRPYLNKVIVATEPGYSTTEIVAIRPFIPLSSSYCCLAFRRPDFVEYVTRLGRGTKMPRLRTPDAVIAVFPLPPLPEQYRIAAKVDELMGLCDELEISRSQRQEERGRFVTASLHSLNNGAASEDLLLNARFCLDHLPLLTASHTQIKEIRNTILNLAVRGKLIHQDPNDEPATELLKRIRNKGIHREEMAQRRKSTLPPIDPDVAPFALPSGWAWARFPDLGTFGRGKSKHRPRNDRSLFDGGKHFLIQTGDVARCNGIITTHTGLYNDTGLAQSKMWPAGTLCITIAANIADSGILGFDACFPDSIVGFIPAPVFPSARYFEYFIRTAKANLLEFAPATAQKNINLEILTAVMVPLPPLSEQSRIVASVDRLMAICDQLDATLVAARTHSSRLLEAVLHRALQVDDNRR